MILTDDKIRRMGKAITLYKPLGETQVNFHKCLSALKWLIGGNRSGKSYTNMMDLALLIMDIHPVRYMPRGRHWVVIESWDDIREIIWEDKLSKFIPKYMYQGNVEYSQHKTPKKIRFNNGHVLEFKAFNQGREALQGRSLDSIHCDEQCLKYDFIQILNELQMRILEKEGFISWSMTPIIPQPELESRIEALPDTDEIFKINLNDNRISRGGHIPDNGIDAMIAQWPEETQATRIAGEFGSFFGAVFKTYNRSIHVIDRFRIPNEWRRYRSFDWGFTNPNVCLWLAKDNDENWYVYRELYKSQSQPSDFLREVLLLSKGETYTANIGDPEDAAAMAKCRELGIRIRNAKKDVHSGIECVQSKFKIKANGKPSLFIFKTCQYTPREIAAYRYPKGTAGSDPKDMPVKKDDHTVDALRYAIYTIDGGYKKSRVYIP